MTIKELQDYIFDQYLIYGNKVSGIDSKFKLELDEDNWKEMQEDIRKNSGNVFINGEHKEEPNISEYTFTNLRIPYIGEFEIIKSDKLNIEKIEE